MKKLNIDSHLLGNQKYKRYLEFIENISHQRYGVGPLNLVKSGQLFVCKKAETAVPMKGQETTRIQRSMTKSWGWGWGVMDGVGVGVGLGVGDACNELPHQI